jgi:hypothetical protein
MAFVYGSTESHSSGRLLREEVFLQRDSKRFQFMLGDCVSARGGWGRPEPPDRCAGRRGRTHRGSASGAMCGAPATPQNVCSPHKPAPSPAKRNPRTRHRKTADFHQVYICAAMTSSAGHQRHEINRAERWLACEPRAFSPATPGRTAVVGVGRAHAPQVRRARAPAGRAPTSRSRSRAIAGRERNTVPEDGAPRAESDGMVFPMPARTVTGENRLLWYITDLLQPTLPRGFNSWTQVLSDWAVSRVWLAAKVPPCLDSPSGAGGTLRYRNRRCNSSAATPPLGRPARLRPSSR